MKLSSFMSSAYPEGNPSSQLKKSKKDMIFSLEDLADRIGERPDRACVEELVGGEASQIELLLSSQPDKRCAMIWGYISSLAAERSPLPLRLPARDYAGLELKGGSIILEKGGEHVGERMSGGRIVGERMSGGRIVVQGAAGNYLGQEMKGGGIVAAACRDYAFRQMKGGWGVVRGEAGKFLGLGNLGGRIAVQGSCRERAGWMMRAGRLYVRGDAGEYLGLLMSGGEILVRGKAGRRAGWRSKGGRIAASHFGPEAADGVIMLD